MLGPLAITCSVFGVLMSPMSDILKNAFPAIIALLGTIVVALIGYRQWKRQQEATRGSEFRSQKQQTYRELWDQL